MISSAVPASKRAMSDKHAPAAIAAFSRTSAESVKQRQRSEEHVVGTEGEDARHGLDVAPEVGVRQLAP